MDDNKEHISLLLDVIKEWVKLRGRSIASIEMEKHKKKATTKKKRSLRTELKWQGNIED